MAEAVSAVQRNEYGDPQGYPETQAYAWWSRHDEYDLRIVFEHALYEEMASEHGTRST